jgi:hypothetical protein
MAQHIKNVCLLFLKDFFPAKSAKRNGNNKTNHDDDEKFIFKYISQ